MLHVILTYASTRPPPPPPHDVGPTPHPEHRPHGHTETMPHPDPNIHPLAGRGQGGLGLGRPPGSPRASPPGDPGHLVPRRTGPSGGLLTSSNSIGMPPGRLTIRSLKPAPFPCIRRRLYLMHGTATTLSPSLSPTATIPRS